MRWSSVLCIVLLLAGDSPSVRAAPVAAGALESVRPAFDPRSVQLPASAPELHVRAALRAGDLALARRLGEAALGSSMALDSDSALQRGRVLWLLARASESPAPRYRALFESHHPLSRWAGLRLAERLERTDKDAAMGIAKSLSRGWTGAARAQRLLTRIALANGPITPAPALANDPASELERAKQLIATQRYELAESALVKLVQRAKSDPELSCKVSFELGRTFVYQKERDKSAALMLELAGRCADPELKAWARYYAGQAKLRSADPAGAIDALNALVAEAPSSSLADDALHMQSVAYADQGLPSEQRAKLEQLVASYPNGDMRSDASFTLAMLARTRGDLSGALTHLDALMQSGLDDMVEGQEGRAAYWHARTLSDLGRHDQALAAYSALVRRYIQTYYAQHALGRIDLLDAAGARALRGELSAGMGVGVGVGLDVTTPDAPLFDYRAEMDEAAFATALELLRVGEPDLALEELQSLTPKSEPRDSSLRWLFAALFNEAGEHEQATRVARPLVAELLRSDDLARSLPRLRALLRTAYPQAFAPVLEGAASEAGVPATLVRAIAREESSFDPEAQSPARAYGALQLIVPTARSIAKPLGLPSDAAALKRPEINLRLGARFMASLLARYAGYTPLLPAAYNAGPGATERFLSEQRGVPLDAFVEAIPYRETRRYTRRVLQAYGFYRWLDGGEVASLPVEIPAALHQAELSPNESVAHSD